MLPCDKEPIVTIGFSQINVSLSSTNLYDECFKTENKKLFAETRLCFKVKYVSYKIVEYTLGYVSIKMLSRQRI